MKKDLQLYTTALELHAPHCCISRSSTSQLVSPSAGCETGSSPPRVSPQASNSTSLAVPSLSTSLSSSLGLQTLDSVKNTHHSPSAPATLASSSSSPADLFITPSPSPATVPYSLSFSTLPPPHSLFSQESPITCRSSNVTGMTASLVSNSNNLTAAAQPQFVEEAIYGPSAVSADACFSTSHSDTLDDFLMKPPSYITALSNVVPSYTRAATENAAQGLQTNIGRYRGNPNNSSTLCSLFPLNPQDPHLQPVSVSRQESLESFPAPAFAFKPCYSRQMTPNPTPLLSRLTVPTPLSGCQTTSSSFDRLISHASPLPPPLSDPSRDLSLSELLEVNDWILGGSSNQ